MSRQQADAAQGRKPKRRRSMAKVLFLLILLLLIVIASMVGWSYKTTTDSLAVRFTDPSPEVEVGGDYASMDYVSSSVGDVEVQNSIWTQRRRATAN